MEFATTSDLFVASYDLLPALHESISSVLGLNTLEEARCQVFAVGADMSGPGAAEKARFALARPLSPEQLAGLPSGTIILYNVKAELPEVDFPKGSYTVATTLGQLRRYDTKRGLLYASAWQECESSECDFTNDVITGVWAVERFIPQPSTWVN